MSRISYDDYFLEIAGVVAKRSTCRRVPDGIGAVLVRDNRILTTGYCGSVRGQPHCVDAGVGCLIDEKTGGCVRTIHAEVNAVLQAAHHGVRIDGATLYTTMSPCWDCFKAVVGGGIRRIVYIVEYRIVGRQREFAEKIGIAWEHLGAGRYVPGQSTNSAVEPNALVCALCRASFGCAHIHGCPASTEFVYRYDDVWRCVECCSKVGAPHFPSCIRAAFTYVAP